MSANPFPGLRPFQPEDTDHYFGRDKQREEILERLRTHRFLAVVGTSGSGKSSLVRAGLIPDLKGGYLERGGPQWRVIIFTPGNRPFDELASNLASSFPGTQADVISDTLKISSSGLNRFVRRHLDSKCQNLLLIVDQFEELIRYSSEEAAAFVRMLLASTGQEGLADPESPATEADQVLPIYVVLTMRSDFLGKCARFRGLPEALNDNQYLVPRLTRDEQGEVIECPIQMAGARITPCLVQRLLNDVGDNPDQLPVLQHAMMRTWVESSGSREQGQEIDTVHYQTAGGMQGALNQDAERAFAELGGNPEKELIAKRIFQRLVEPGNIDEESRRPSPLSKLVYVTGVGEAQVREVIEVFRSRGFLTLSSAHDPVVDIPHESLIRLWSRLRDWVKDERKSAETYLGLVKSSNEGLAVYRGVALLLAANWEKSNKPNAEWARRYTPEDPTAFPQAIEFLGKSRKARRNRWVLAFAGATGIAALLLYANFMNLRAAAKGKSDRAYREGVTKYLSADQGGAISKFQEALKTYRENGDAEAAAVTLVNIGMAYAASGDHYNAIDYFKSAIKVYNDSPNDPKGKAVALTHVGEQYLKLVPEKTEFSDLSRAEAATVIEGNFRVRESAIDSYEQALVIYKAKQDLKTEADIAKQLAAVYKTNLNELASVELLAGGQTVPEREHRSDSQSKQDDKSDPVAKLKPKESEYRQSEVKYLTEELDACRQSQDTDLRRQAAILMDLSDELSKGDDKAKAAAIADFRSAIYIYRTFGSAAQLQESAVRIAKAFTPGDPNYMSVTNIVESYYLNRSPTNADPFYNPKATISDFYSSVGDEHRSLRFAYAALQLYLTNLDFDSADAMYRRIATLEWKQNNKVAALDALVTLYLYNSLILSQPSTKKWLDEFAYKHGVDNRRNLLKAYKEAVAQAKKDNDRRDDITYKLSFCAKYDEYKADVISSCIREAIAGYRGPSDAKYQAALLMLARAEQLSEDQSSALKDYNSVLDIVKVNNAVPAQIVVRRVMATSYPSASRLALENRLELATLYSRCDYEVGEAESYYMAGKVLDDMQDPQKAIEYYKMAYDGLIKYYKRQGLAENLSEQIRIKKIVLERLSIDYEQMKDKDATARTKAEIAALDRSTT